MSLLDARKNFAITDLNSGYSELDTDIVTITDGGAKFPDPALNGAFNLVWWNYTDYKQPSDDPNVEIVRCTDRDGDKLTVIRAQESTTATAKNTTGKTYKIMLGVTAKMIDDVDTGLMNSVPYTGATNNVDIGVYSFTAQDIYPEQIIFGTYSISPTYGRFRYIEGLGTYYDGATFFFGTKFDVHEYYLSGPESTLNVTNYGGMGTYDADMTLTTNDSLTFRPQPPETTSVSDLGMLNYNWTNLFMTGGIRFYENAKSATLKYSITKVGDNLEFDGVGDVIFNSRSIYLPKTTDSDNGIIYKKDYSGTYRNFINTYGQGNTFFGFSSGNTTLTGTYNTVFGIESGAAFTLGEGNLLFGYAVAPMLDVGSYNLYFGTGAGGGGTSNSYNTCVGAGSGSNMAEGDTNKTYIGNDGFGSPALFADFNTMCAGPFNEFPAYMWDIPGDCNALAYHVNGVAGVDGTITLAKLTPGGSNGSITIDKGIITGFTDPT